MTASSKDNGLTQYSKNKFSYLNRLKDTDEVQDGAKERSKASSKALATRRLDLAKEEEIIDLCLRQFEDPKVTAQEKQNAFMRSTIIYQKSQLSAFGLLIDCMTRRVPVKKGDVVGYKLISATDMLEEIADTLFGAMGVETNDKDEVTFKGDLLATLDLQCNLLDYQLLQNFMVATHKVEEDEENNPFYRPDVNGVSKNVFGGMQDRISNLNFTNSKESYSRQTTVLEDDDGEGVFEKSPASKEKT